MPDSQRNPKARETGLRAIVGATPFVKHPLAVLLSVFLGMLLVVLIHQNLTDQVLWEGAVEITMEASDGTSRKIVLTAPPGYVIRVPSLSQTNLKLRGVRKDTLGNWSVDAQIPAQRFDDTRADEWQRIVIEDSDLKVQGFEDVRCESEPKIEVAMAAMRSGRVNLSADLTARNPDLIYETEWKPSANLELVIPAPSLVAGPHTHSVEIAAEDGATRTITSIDVGGVRVPLDQAYTVTVSAKAKPDTEHELTVSVRAYLLGADDPKRQWNIRVDQLAEKSEVSVVLRGTKEAVEQWKQRKEELKKILHVTIDAAGVASKNMADIRRADEGGWHTNLEGVVPEQLVSQLSPPLRIGNIFRVTAAFKLRNP